MKRRDESLDRAARLAREEERVAAEKHREAIAEVERKARVASQDVASALETCRATAVEDSKVMHEKLRDAKVEVRSIHWSPYDRVGVVNAVP